MTTPVHREDRTVPTPVTAFPVVAADTQVGANITAPMIMVDYESFAIAADDTAAIVVLVEAIRQRHIVRLEPPLSMPSGILVRQDSELAEDVENHITFKWRGDLP